MPPQPGATRQPLAIPLSALLRMPIRPPAARVAEAEAEARAEAEKVAEEVQALQEGRTRHRSVENTRGQDVGVSR